MLVFLSRFDSKDFFFNPRGKKHAVFDMCVCVCQETTELLGETNVYGQVL